MIITDRYRKDSGEPAPTAWTVPEWMRPYLYLVTDGNRAEELMNDRSKVTINAPLALHATSVHGQITMLLRLHAAGLLAPAPAPPVAPQATP